KLELFVRTTRNIELRGIAYNSETSPRNWAVSNRSRKTKPRASHRPVAPVRRLRHVRFGPTADVKGIAHSSRANPSSSGQRVTTSRTTSLCFPDNDPYRGSILLLTAKKKRREYGAEQRERSRRSWCHSAKLRGSDDAARQ